MSDSSSDRSQVLRAAAARKHQDAVHRAERAIRQLVKEGRPVSFKAVAEHAPCSTAFLYGHAELKRRITHLREQHRRAALPVLPVDPDAPSSVVRTLTLQIAALKRRHRDELAQLRHDLAAAHGEIRATAQPRRANADSARAGFCISIFALVGLPLLAPGLRWITCDHW